MSLATYLSIMGRLKKVLGIQPGGSGGTKIQPVTPNVTCLTIQAGVGSAAATTLLSILDTNSVGLTVVNGSGISGTGSAGGGWDIRQLVGFSCRTSSTHVNLGSSSLIRWANNADWFGGSGDLSLYRAAAGVVAIGTGAASGEAWLQQGGSPKRLGANVTESAGTLTNLTDLTHTLVAGRKYVGRMVITCKNSVNTDGIKFDLNGGSATVTSVSFGVAGATTGVRVSTSLSTAVTIPAFPDTSDIIMVIPMGLVCNTGGTLIPRFAVNTFTSGTATVELNSFFQLDDSPN